MAVSALTSRFDAALAVAKMQAGQQAPTGPAAKARANAQDFEAMFLNSMFEQMMTGLDGEGPFGGSPGVGVWRSFLTNEFAKSIAQKGGIGIADQVYSSLIAEQAASSNTAPAGAQTR